MARGPEAEIRRGHQGRRRPQPRCPSRGVSQAAHTAVLRSVRYRSIFTACITRRRPGPSPGDGRAPIGLSRRPSPASRSSRHAVYRFPRQRAQDGRQREPVALDRQPARRVSASTRAGTFACSRWGCRKPTVTVTSLGPKEASISAKQVATLVWHGAHTGDSLSGAGAGGQGTPRGRRRCAYRMRSCLPRSGRQVGDFVRQAVADWRHTEAPGWTPGPWPRQRFLSVGHAANPVGRPSGGLRDPRTRLPASSCPQGLIRRPGRRGGRGSRVGPCFRRPV